MVFFGLKLEPADVAELRRLASADSERSGERVGLSELARTAIRQYVHRRLKTKGE